MVSILIPIYNRDARMLVREIIHQAELLGIEFEVICFDNHSVFYRDKNIQIANFTNCSYEYLNEGINTHAVRNRLADAAKYNYLLFLDSDLKIDYHHFLKNYIQEIPKSEVICGGIHYLPWPPTSEYTLHWLYGMRQEMKKSIKNYSFLSCNFMIKRTLFDEIRFDENLKEFGHQDPVFGMELNRRRINRKHVFSPVAHNGLDHTDVFLERIRETMHDLAEYLKLTAVTYRDAKGYRYLRFFLLMKRVKISSVFEKLFRVMIKPIESNLRSQYPILMFLKVYKIWFLCHYFHKKFPTLH
ncbi:MAG: glycosyltransferase family 2 protein [Bacteroidales bacterium]